MANINRAYSPEQLAEVDRQYLVSLRSHPGYPVLLTLMEQACEEFATAVINADPANHDDVLAKQVMAKSAWTFFTKVQKRVEYEVSEAIAAQDPPEPELIGLTDIPTP